VVGSADDAIHPAVVQAEFFESLPVGQVELRDSDSMAATPARRRRPLVRTFLPPSRYGLVLKPFSATFATYISGLTVSGVVRAAVSFGGVHCHVLAGCRHRGARACASAGRAAELRPCARLRRLLGSLPAAFHGVEVSQRQLGVDDSMSASGSMAARDV